MDVTARRGEARRGIFCFTATVAGWLAGGSAVSGRARLPPRGGRRQAADADADMAAGWRDAGRIISPSLFFLFFFSFFILFSFCDFVGRDFSFWVL